MAMVEDHAPKVTKLTSGTSSEEQLLQAMTDNADGNNTNWITRSKWFKNLSKWAFSVCDKDKTGHITKAELYTGVILVHLKIAKYAGAAACFVSGINIVGLFEMAG